MGDEFFKLLYKRIGANEFTAQRLEDAVEHVIDNFRYKELNVADVVSFDRRVRLYSYDEVCDICANGRAVMSEDFEKVRIGEKLYWAKKVDLLNASR